MQRKQSTFFIATTNGRSSDMHTYIVRTSDMLPRDTNDNNIINTHNWCSRAASPTLVEPIRTHNGILYGGGGWRNFNAAKDTQFDFAASAWAGARVHRKTLPHNSHAARDDRLARKLPNEKKIKCNKIIIRENQNPYNVCVYRFLFTHRMTKATNKARNQIILFMKKQKKKKRKTQRLTRTWTPSINLTVIMNASRVCDVFFVLTFMHCLLPLLHQDCTFNLIQTWVPYASRLDHNNHKFIQVFLYVFI